MYINTENTEEFSNNIEKELNIINQYISIQREKRTIVFEEHNIIIMNSLRTHLKEWEELISEANDISKYLDENNSFLEAMQKQLREISDLIIESQLKKSKNENYENILENINKIYSGYINLKENNMKKMLENINKIENFSKKTISNIKKSIYEEDLFKINPFSTPQKQEVKTKKETLIRTDKQIKNQDDNNQDNKVLIISEKDNKVYLPYSMVDLKRELKEKKEYNKIEELIESEYILDLDRFKNSIASRFKEAYKLIKKKEKRSIIDATGLGIELMFNYSLNPAIIAACKNEDELDIYLDCLEENELDSFKIFDVKYEVLPTININRKQNK